MAFQGRSDLYRCTSAISLALEQQNRSNRTFQLSPVMSRCAAWHWACTRRRLLPVANEGQGRATWTSSAWPVQACTACPCTRRASRADSCRVAVGRGCRSTGFEPTAKTLQFKGLQRTLSTILLRGFENAHDHRNKTNDTATLANAILVQSKRCAVFAVKLS